jgi:hypothetical protein
MHRVYQVYLGKGFHNLPQGQTDIFKPRAEIFPPIAGNQDKAPPIQG